jgi:uncharacterized protein (TIGR03437 family)
LGSRISESKVLLEEFLPQISARIKVSLMRLSWFGHPLLIATIAVAFVTPVRAESGTPAAANASPVASPPQSATQPSWQDWFYAQRRYGLGQIPDKALARAIAQRDAMQRRPRFLSQSEGPGASAAAQWVSIGPSVVNSPTRGLISGRITSLSIDPTNPSTVYIASAGGGVWKSLNRGSSWTPMTDNLPSLASGAVAVDPFTGEVWYGTGELDFCRDCYLGAGVYRSPDGGANWSRVAADTFLSSPTSVIVFDRRNQGTLFIGRSSALWKTADGGQSWHATLLGTVTDLALSPVDSNIAYAALGNAFGAPENGVYRSADGGQSWNRLGGGLPDPSTMGRIALTVDPANPATVYALITRSSDFLLNGLYRSLDGGNTWNILGSLPRDNFQEAQFANGLFNLLVRVDPSNPAILYVGSNDLLKSTDNGASWQALHMLQGEHDVVFDPSDPQTFYLINNSGVWKSSNGGQSFLDLNNTLAITQLQTVGLHPYNPNLALGATQDNGTILYGGGFAWDQGRLGDSGAAFYDALNPQKLYASGHYTDLFRSDDGGKTFALISQGIAPTDRAQFYAPFLQAPGQTGSLYFATQRVWWSGDQGDHWTAISGDLTGGGSASISVLAAAPNLPQVLYVGTSDSLVSASLDGGKNWSPTASLPNRFITSIAIHPQNPFQAFVGLSGFGTGHVFRTDNRGGSWVDITGNLPDIPVNAILIDALSSDRIYVGTDIGVFGLSPDGSWSPMNQGLPNVIVLGLTQNPTSGVLVAATHGRGAFALAASLKAPRMDALINSASSAHAPLAPGLTVNLLGSNLADGPAVPTNSSPLPVLLAGSIITVNDITVPLLSASPGQVSFLVPFGISGTQAVVTLSNGSGQATVRVPQAVTSPGIFMNGADPNIFHASGVLVSDAAPARAGEELVIYAAGLGPVDQTLANGAPSPSNPPAKTLLQPVVRVGGVAANVLFSGLTPGLIATYQVNFVMPPGFSGKTPMLIDMGSGSLSNTVLLSSGQ